MGHKRQENKNLWPTGHGSISSRQIKTYDRLDMGQQIAKNKISDN